VSFEAQISKEETEISEVVSETTMNQLEIFLMMQSEQLRDIEKLLL
jgi:hypothetical protein